MLFLGVVCKIFKRIKQLYLQQYINYIKKTYIIKLSSIHDALFKNKGNVLLMLNESLNEFKFDSTRFQQAFNTFTLNNIKRPVQTPPIFGATKRLRHVEAKVETI